MSSSFSSSLCLSLPLSYPLFLASILLSGLSCVLPRHSSPLSASIRLDCTQRDGTLAVSCRLASSTVQIRCIHLFHIDAAMGFAKIGDPDHQVCGLLLERYASGRQPRSQYFPRFSLFSRAVAMCRPLLLHCKNGQCNCVQKEWLRKASRTIAAVGSRVYLPFSTRCDRAPPPES